MTVIAYIPARSGSKRLPGKNFIPFHNSKSLTEIALEFSRTCSFVDVTVLDTDNEEFLSYAKSKHLADKYIQRHELLAGDTCSTRDTLLHALGVADICNSECILLLQPTSPIRSAKLFNAMYEYYSDNDLSLLLASSHLPISLTDIYYRKSFEKICARSETYDESQLFFDSGLAYFVSRDRLLHNNNCFAPLNKNEVFQVPLWMSIDIDHDYQFEMAQMLYSSQLNF